jgi:hypothetical protein
MVNLYRPETFVPPEDRVKRMFACFLLSALMALTAAAADVISDMRRLQIRQLAQFRRLNRGTPEISTELLRR